MAVGVYSVVCVVKQARGATIILPNYFSCKRFSDAYTVPFEISIERQNSPVHINIVNKLCDRDMLDLKMLLRSECVRVSKLLQKQNYNVDSMLNVLYL